MNMISENFGDLLDPRFRKIYDEEYEENIKDGVKDLLYTTINPGKRDNYKVSGVGAMGDMEEWGGSVTYDDFVQLYDTTIEFTQFVTGFKVERKLADDELFGIMDGRPRQMAISVARTREKKAASPFNTGFTATASTSTDISGGDGVPLFSSSHPYSPEDATTYDNSGTDAISATSIEATRRIGLRDIPNDRGEMLNVNYDTIICTSVLQQKVWEIIKSDKIVDSAYNNKNFHQGRYDMIVWDRLSDSNNWLH